jgi:hypothetical protein
LSIAEFREPWPLSVMPFGPRAMRVFHTRCGGCRGPHSGGEVIRPRQCQVYWGETDEGFSEPRGSNFRAHRKRRLSGLRAGRVGRRRIDFNFLDGVSCTSRASCTAVGYSDTAPPITTSLAERWNGTKWVIQATPNPPGGLTYLPGRHAARGRPAAGRRHVGHRRPKPGGAAGRHRLHPG